MISDDAALENVTLGEEGILENLGPGGIHVVMSIISPAYTWKMTDLHTHRNCAYLAAPVFGRPDQAAAQKLWICFAGGSKAKERVHPILLHLGQGIFDFGADPAIAPIVKICGNFLIASAMEDIFKTLDLAEKNGLDHLLYLVRWTAVAQLLPYLRYLAFQLARSRESALLPLLASDVQCHEAQHTAL